MSESDDKGVAKYEWPIKCIICRLVVAAIIISWATCHAMIVLDDPSKKERRAD